MGEAATRQELRVRNGVPTAVELWEDLSHELWEVQVGVGGEANAKMMTLAEIDAAFKKHEITTSSLVRKPGVHTWRTLGEIGDAAAAPSPSPPKPPTPPRRLAVPLQSESVEAINVSVSDVVVVAAEEPSSLSPFAVDTCDASDSGAKENENEEAPKSSPLPTHKIRSLTTEELRVARPKIFTKKLVGIATAALLAGGLLVIRFVPSVHDHLVHHDTAPATAAIATPVATTTTPFVAAAPIPPPPAPAPPAPVAAAPTPTPAAASPAPVAAAAPAPVAPKVTTTASHASAKPVATKMHSAHNPHPATKPAPKTKVADAKHTKKGVAVSAPTSAKAKTAADSK